MKMILVYLEPNKAKKNVPLSRYDANIDTKTIQPLSPEGERLMASAKAPSMPRVTSLTPIPG